MVPPVLVQWDHVGLVDLAPFPDMHHMCQPPRKVAIKRNDHHYPTSHNW